MNEQELHNRIEQDCPEEKAADYARMEQTLHAAYAQGMAEAKPVKAPLRRRLWFALTPAVACVLCLAIMLPILLKDKPARSQEQPENFYQYAESYAWVDSPLTLKEYASLHNLSFRYLDWYDEAESVTTSINVDKDDPSKVLFYSEIILHGETYYEVWLHVMPKNLRVKDFESYHEICKQELVAKGHTFKWADCFDFSEVVLEYGDYTYYLSLVQITDEETVISIVEDLLP